MDVEVGEGGSNGAHLDTSAFYWTEYEDAINRFRLLSNLLLVSYPSIFLDYSFYDFAGFLSLGNKLLI